MVSNVRIERPTGYIEVLEDGIIYCKFHDGTQITEAHAREELAIFDELVEAGLGRLLLINDLRGRITTDRGARRVYGTYSRPGTCVAFLFDSKIVEMGLNFIAKIYPPENTTLQAFRELEDAHQWLASFLEPVERSA